ncbi:hypothetical protein GALL_489050 [mine drainage metagenome]|uniref:Uncharacterized protein n=1 Tax=mine drainage metagenome TaxID=410659 RepID=A0A1J5Q0V2_9ZZZZ
MHDTGTVGGYQRTQNVLHDGHGLNHRQGTLCSHLLAQGLAWHVFKHQIRLPTLDIGFKHRDDIGMCQAADAAGFL